jgi:hypothetical protein
MRKLAIWVCLVLAVPVFARTHKVPSDAPIATVQIPDQWQTKERGEFVEAISPDGAVCFLIGVAEASKTAESIGEVMRYLRNRDNITVRSDSMKREQGKLSGFDVWNMSWQGKDKNGDVEIRFIIVSIAENRSLLNAYWGSQEARKKHQAELDKMLQSIKKP